MGLGISLSMAFAGYQAARASIIRFQSGGLAVDPGLPTLVLVASAIIKFGMFWIIRGIAVRSQEPGAQCHCAR